MTGPLDGVRVLELGGIGPGPFGAMMLSDLGADVLRLERPNAPGFSDTYDRRSDVLLRGRPSISVDLRCAAGRAFARRLATAADVFIDPFRPGTADRLGLGAGDLLEANPRLVYAHITGWGQEGPLAAAAGHDINYLALSGVLSLLGRRGSPPPPPLNLVADFGGGGMLLVVGVLAALVERGRSGRGQILDAAMVDGSALECAMVIGMIGSGAWKLERESNFLDGGAPFYDTYSTADGGYVAVGALEPRFFEQLLLGLGFDRDAWSQWDRGAWPEMRAAFARAFRARTRDEWDSVFAGTDACVTPVLTPSEAATHPQNHARRVFLQQGGNVQPAPAPRFSRSTTRVRTARDVDAVLDRWLRAVDAEMPPA